MVTGQSLQSKFEESAKEIESLVAGMSEDQARKAPAEGEWCAREVLIHLAGDADESFLDGLHRFQNEDTPRFELVPGTVATNADREKMPLAELAKAVAKQYRDMGAFIGSLDEEQLGRSGRIGFLKQYTGSEDITLGNWATIMANMHLPGHVEQLRALV